MSDYKLDWDALQAIAIEAHDALAKAGYVVATPDDLQNFPICLPVGLDVNTLSARLLVHADFGAGGFKDVVVAFQDDRLCRVYVGPTYDIPPSETRKDVEVPPCQFWYAFSIPREDMAEILLRKVRKLVLDPDYRPGMESSD